jgi:hypothetical protein
MVRARKRVTLWFLRPGKDKERLKRVAKLYVDLQQVAAVLLPLDSADFHQMEIPEGNPGK